MATAAVEAGGLTSVNEGMNNASQLRSQSSYAEAVAEYQAVARRSGLAYLLAHGSIDAAALDAQSTLLDWARNLAADGKVDQALEMTMRVTDLSLRADAQRVAAQIGLDEARRQAATGHADLALSRLDRVTTGTAPDDLVAQAATLRPQYSLDGARALLDAGDAQKAVVALDAVLTLTPTGPLADAARGLLPQALLAAGRNALAAHDEQGALVPLQRLTGVFAATTQASTARQLLAAPQSVTGTLVHRDGQPATSVRVRLGSDYRKVGNGFLTNPPYYSARSDNQGTFVFTGIPVGARLTLEISENGQWTVIEADASTPAGQRPLYDVTVTPLTPVDLAFVRLAT